MALVRMQFSENQIKNLSYYVKRTNRRGYDLIRNPEGQKKRKLTTSQWLIALLHMLDIDGLASFAYQDSSVAKENTAGGGGGGSAQATPNKEERQELPEGYQGLVAKMGKDAYDVVLPEKYAAQLTNIVVGSVGAEQQPQRQRVAKRAVIVKSRCDLSFEDVVMCRADADAPRATIFAPIWVQGVLAVLSSQDLLGVELQLPNGTTSIIDGRITLPQLHLMARNESKNCDGKIAWQQYSGITKEAILALKNLVTQTVVVCRDEIVKQGGFPRGQAQQVSPARPVIICDLSGLQFQQLNNTGWAVLIPDPKSTSATKAPLSDVDRLMHHYIVGGEQVSYEDCAADQTGRYQKNGAYYFDTVAFQRMIAQDFALAATAVNSQALDGEDLCFRFLKQGCGFFAQMLTAPRLNFGPLAEANIGLGIYLGLQALFAQDASTYSHIKRIEFPFYDEKSFPAALWSKIEALCTEHGVAVACTKEDALAAAADDLTVAVTNCADPHAPAGNEMRWGSVDAMIAENTRGKCRAHPLTSGPMKSMFIDVVVPSQKMALAAAAGGGAKADGSSAANSRRVGSATPGGAAAAGASPAEGPGRGPFLLGQGSGGGS